MSKRDSFKPYRRVIGANIPLHRVRRTDEDPNGRGTMFLTEGGGTFSRGNIKGHMAAIIGGGLLVVIDGQNGDEGYQYIVKIQDVVEAAIDAFEQRKPDGDPS